jgi:hypothetical protein
MLGFTYDKSVFIHHNLVDHQLPVGCGYSQYIRNYPPYMGVVFSIHSLICPPTMGLFHIAHDKQLNFVLPYEAVGRKKQGLMINISPNLFPLNYVRSEF